MKNYLVPLVIAAAFVLGSVVNSSGLQEEKPKKNVLVEVEKPQVQGWEIKRTARWEEAEKLAADGWEFVNGTHSTQSTDQYFFKRPKQ